MREIVTTELPTQRAPTEAEIASAGQVLQELSREAAALGDQPAAAPVHYAMGRVYGDRLGDLRSAAVCYQNAFLLNPAYRPNLEAARQLFTGAGQLDKALALHEREEALLGSAAERAESLRAQAALLAQQGDGPEAARRVQKALEMAPDHPALLATALEGAAGDKLGRARLLLRSAAAVRDDVQKAQLLRRAVLLVEEMQADRSLPGFPPGAPRPAAEELDALYEEALRRLHSADPKDPVGVLGLLQRARQANDWEAVLRLSRERAERTGGPSERVVVANIAAHRLGRVAEALAEVGASLEDDRRDGALLALRAALCEQQHGEDLAEALRARAAGSVEPSERADLKISAAALLPDPLDQEQLLSEALAENPGDAAAIALHARLVALRDSTAAAERFVALGDALHDHAPAEAAGNYLEAGAWLERAGQREEAAQMARKALSLAPRPAAGGGRGGPAQGALRLLVRTLPFLGAHAELVAMLEEAAADLPRAPAAEMLARAAALLSDVPPAPEESAPHPRTHALALAQRAAELARGLATPRWLESWTALAVRCGDLPSLSLALETRAEAAQGADAADLLVEAAELSRATLDDARALALLGRARTVDRSSEAARRGLLAMPQLPAAERVDLLGEEARSADPARGAALHAERAALFEGLGRFDEAVQASAQALALGDVDLAVLRRLARVQTRRGDHPAALAVLVQIAQAVPEGSARAEAWARAADFAEWRVSDPRHATELYAAAADAHPSATYALVQLARLHAWTGRLGDAAAAFESLAQRSSLSSERTEALRWAASLHAYRNGQPAQAADLYRRLLADAPGDLEAMAALLQLTADGEGEEARRERAELRGKLASRCQDPRFAALLRAESAHDRLAAGERDQAVAEYRRALALNPHDRIALDLVEEALRASGQNDLLAEHLAFRCAYAEGEIRAALALQHAELLEERGDFERAAAAYRQALASDPGSLLAVRGARRLTERIGDPQERMQLLAQEAGLAADAGVAAGSLVEAALLAEGLGESGEAAQHLTALLERDPRNAEAAVKLRSLLGEDGAHTLAALYERTGAHHQDAAAGGAAWALAARIELSELNDPAAAFFATGRALARDATNSEALELRAAAALATGREVEAADALAQRLAQPGAPDDLRLKLGKVYAEKLGEPERAVALLRDRLEALDLPTLVALAPTARALQPAEATRLLRRLLETAAEGGVPRARLAEWTEELGRAHLAQGQADEALAAFKRAAALDPTNRAALRQVAELSAGSAPDEAIAAHRGLLELSPADPQSLHALFELFRSRDRAEAAFSAAAVLAGLGLATPEEQALHQQTAAQPPPADLPLLSDDERLRAPGDGGAARELLAAAAPDLATALATGLNGRGDRVKGDNPVRRVCAAIARALGIPEPALYVGKGEPALVVVPTATEPPGLLVGLEVPKRYHSRQQRFLYARALAHIRRGTHALYGLTAERLGHLVGELARLAAPAGTDFGRLPGRDAPLGEALEKAFPPEARARLATLAARAAAEAPASWESLALALRETAERAALVICADPAAALGIVLAECPGGLERPEVARLARFAVSEAYLELRAG